MPRRRIRRHMKKTASPKRIIITAGPTREVIDPVRYISNYSTGMMGYALAEEAVRLGFKVTLITGPVDIEAPESAETIKVETSGEMAKELFARLKNSDCVIMAAAVCDFKPTKVSSRKIKKKRTLTLELEKTVDILKAIGKRKGLVKVGFALETESPLENAGKKIKEKDLDLIVINIKTAKSDPFGGGAKKYIVMDKAGNAERFGPVEKPGMARIIIGKAKELMI